MHVRGPDGEVVVRIDDGAVIAGELRSRQIEEARQWIEANRAMLLEIWMRRL